eukprot:7102018-Prymnesium_polylepis.1
MPTRRRSIRSLRLLGDPVLARVSRELAQGEALQPSLLRRMRKCMVEAGGSAVSAVQVGEPVRAMMVSKAGDLSAPPRLVLNPRILKQSKRREVDWESCLSVPNYTALVSRPHRVVAAYETTDGESVERVLSGCGTWTPYLTPFTLLLLCHMLNPRSALWQLPREDLPARAGPSGRRRVHRSGAPAFARAPESVEDARAARRASTRAAEGRAGCEPCGRGRESRLGQPTRQLWAVSHCNARVSSRDSAILRSRVAQAPVDRPLAQRGAAAGGARRGERAKTRDSPQAIAIQL